MRSAGKFVRCLAVSLDEFSGNQTALNFVRKSLDRHSLSHSLLVTGGSGRVRQSFARFLAMTLNCEHESFFKSCDCVPCRKIESGNHPDVKWYGIEEEATRIKIAIVKDLIHWIGLKPFEAKMKVFVVSEAQAMTLESQNALLKTLEEPPPHSQIILLAAEASSLLETILSRCVEIKLGTQIQAEEIDQEKNARLLADWIRLGSWAFFSQQAAKTREDQREIVSLIIRFLRDVLVYQETSRREMLYLPQELARIQSMAGSRSQEKIRELLGDLLEIRESLENNLNQKITANYLAVKLEESLF